MPEAQDVAAAQVSNRRTASPSKCNDASFTECSFQWEHPENITSYHFISVIQIIIIRTYVVKNDSFSHNFHKIFETWRYVILRPDDCFLPGKLPRAQFIGYSSSTLTRFLVFQSNLLALLQKLNSP